MVDIQQNMNENMWAEFRKEPCGLAKEYSPRRIIPRQKYIESLEEENVWSRKLTANNTNKNTQG